MFRVCAWLLCLGPLACPGGVLAQSPLPPLASAQGRDAVVTPAGRGIQITFLPAEWPNAYWSVGGNAAWDWQGHAILAFDASNPGPQPIVFNLRVDDDVNADGVSHSHTVWASLNPGQSGSFCTDVAAADPMLAEGMLAGPPSPGCAGLQAMAGTGQASPGQINPGHVVAFQMFLHQPGAPTPLTVSNLRLIPSLTTAALYSDVCDAYGQFTRQDWPGKLHSDAEFPARRAAEEKELAASPALPDRDPYGGWLNGPTLAAAGYFSTALRDGRWWLVTPGGHLFLSFGVNEVAWSENTFVHPRESLFSWLPAPSSPYALHYGPGALLRDGSYRSDRTYAFYASNLHRKYGLGYPNDWGLAAVARLRSWGFNTLGNWSDEMLEASDQIPYTATLAVGGVHAHLPTASGGGGGMSDPFDAQFALDCDASFRLKAAALRGDPWCLGYFVDNELPWNGGAGEGRYGLAYEALAAPAGQPAKRALLAQLQARYGTIGTFNKAWQTSLPSWAALSTPFQASQTPGAAQQADMAAFVHALARQYFLVVRGALRKYDAHHLYLGCRFGGRNPDAERAAGEVCDVVSFNVYQPTLDPAAWASVQALHKPCLVSEFHVGALDRGTFASGLVSAPSQAARAAAYGEYVNTVVDNPAFVGAHWYKYTDEPLTGRSLDGENFNAGFVSVSDTPYPEMVGAVRQILAGAYPRRASSSP